MKYVRFFLLTIFLIGTKAYSFSPNAIIVNNKLQVSLRNGRAQELAMMFNDEVDLVIDSEDVDYSGIASNHAQLILKSFFMRNPPIDFQTVFRGGAGRYYIGLLRTAKDTFNVSVVMKRAADGEFKIESIRFKMER